MFQPSSIRSRTIGSNGTVRRCTTSTTARGVPVLLMHGNPTWSFLYRDVIAGLDGVRCLAPDYFGFGMSDDGPDGYGYTIAEQAELVGAWIDHLDLDQPFVMVVQDWGGPIGLLNAVQRPKEVVCAVHHEHLGLGPGSIHQELRPGAQQPARQAAHRTSQLLCDHRDTPGNRLREEQASIGIRRIHGPVPDKTARYPTWVMPREILTNDARLEQLERDLAKLKGKPTELVWGMKDRGFGKESVIARWHEALGDVATTRLDDASHFLQEDRPDAIAEPINRLVAQIS